MKTGDRVMFKDSVVKQCGHSKEIADMRGTVLEIIDSIAKVDTGGTFMSEDGRRVRFIPVNNLKTVRN